jgi:hypothetical protein
MQGSTVLRQFTDFARAVIEVILSGLCHRVYADTFGVIHVTLRQELPVESCKALYSAADWDIAGAWLDTLPVTFSCVSEDVAVGSSLSYMLGTSLAAMYGRSLAVNAELPLLQAKY